MSYRIGSGIWSSVFAVPTVVTDEHLKLASGLSVKVLLLLLRHNGSMELKELATLLNQSVSDIQDAVNYWVGHEVLIPGHATEKAPPLEERQPEPEPLPVQLTELIQYQKVEPELEQRKVTTLSRTRQRLTTAEINQMGKQDENIAYLLQETQSVLCKPLTPVATDTVVALYSYYGMQPDMILMLVHYCVSIGKESMRYIEKVAADWLEKGIDSHEKAEAEIVRLTQKNSIENKIKSSFGIYDRSLISSEKKYIETWVNEYKMDLTLINLAYEKAVERKGQLNFAYINGILSNWHSKGVSTIADALRDQADKPKKAYTKEARGESSYDIGELENMINYGDIL